MPETLPPLPPGKYAAGPYATPLWFDTAPVFFGRVESCDGESSCVMIEGTDATLRVSRDDPKVRYRRKLRLVFGSGGGLERVVDERGCPVDLADWGSLSDDKRVLTLDIISERTNPRFTVEHGQDGTWYHPVEGLEPTFVPAGEDPAMRLGCLPVAPGDLGFSPETLKALESLPVKDAPSR